MPTPETFPSVAFTALIFYLLSEPFRERFSRFRRIVFFVVAWCTYKRGEFPRGLYYCFTSPFESSFLVSFPIIVFRSNIFDFVGSLVTHNLSYCRLLNLDSSPFIKTSGSVMSPFSNFPCCKQQSVEIWTLGLWGKSGRAWLKVDRFALRIFQYCLDELQTSCLPSWYRDPHAQNEIYSFFRWCWRSHSSFLLKHCIGTK